MLAAILAYLIETKLFGLSRARNPVNAPGEAAWFVAYGIAAFVYRILITLGIAFFLAGRFFILGVLLASFSLVIQIVVPVIRQTLNLLSGV